MAYCTYADVLAHTGTDLVQATVEALINDSDRRIKAILKANGLTAPTSDDTLTSASIAFTKAQVLMRKRLDGSRPSSISVGGVSRSDTNDKMIDTLEGEGIALIAQYLSDVNGGTVATEAAERADTEMSDLRMGQRTSPTYWEE